MASAGLVSGLHEVIDIARVDVTGPENARDMDSLCLLVEELEADWRVAADVRQGRFQRFACLPGG